VWYKVRVMTEQHVAGASGIPQEEEPKTPMWLTAVGAALFVGVAAWWAVTPSAPSTPVETAPSASAPAAAAAPNPQAQAVPPAQPLQQAAPPALPARIPLPSAAPSAGAPNLRVKPHP
jgi:hypothetical protein